MFAEAVLLRRFTRYRGVFDYLLPPTLQKKLKIGQQVQVPFLKSQNFAVITKLKKTSQYQGQKLKSIEKVTPLPLLPPHLIKLAFWLASWSAVSPATVFKMITPLPPKKIVPRKNESAMPKQLTVSADEVKVIQSLVKTVFQESGQAKKYLAIMPTAKANFGFLIKLCQLAQQKSKSLIIILPTIYQLDLLFCHLPWEVQKQTLKIHSGQSKTEEFNIWQDIAQGKKRIAIGTKLAIFAPFSRLDQIVIVEEENRNHKQEDQNPRFHTRPTAEKLAELCKANLLFLSYSPSQEAWYQIKNSQYQLLEFKNVDAKIKVVDKKDEFLKKNYSPLSEILIDKIKKTLAQKRKIFLYLNRKGVAAALACATCGQIIKCPKCQQIMALAQKEKLTCGQCPRQSRIPSKCPKCQGYNWKKIGWGTKRLVSEIKRRFPKLSISRLDKDSQTINLAGQIIIGTEKALPYLLLIKPGLIGVIAIDSLLTLPDFRASERTYQLLKYLIAHLSWPAEIVIQTFSPQLPVFQAIALNKMDLFYQPELKNRALLKYPPQTRIIKIFHQDQDEAKVAKAAISLFSKLNTLDRNIELIEPVVTSKKEKNKFTKIILLKIPEKNVDSIFSKIVKIIPDNWHIDRDPLVLYT